MKKHVLNLIRKSPASMGLLSLLITLHLVGVKDLRVPMITMQKDLLMIFGLYMGVMLFYVLCILPRIEREKREKITWLVVVSSVLILTIAAKIFVS